MRNSKTSNVAKFKKVHWKYEDGEFAGSMSVYREIFGSFYINFRWAINGRLNMEIKSAGYPELSERAKEYESPEAAAEEIEIYFRGIEGLLQKQMKDAKKRADEAYRAFIREEITKLKEVKMET